MIGMVRRSQATPPSCRTVSGPDSGSPCIFPFIFEGKTKISCVDNGEGRKWCDTQVNSTMESWWGYCNDDCIPTVTHPDLCTQDLGLYICGEVCKEILEPCYGACGEDSYKCGNLCTWNDWDCQCGDVTLTSDSDQICDLPTGEHCTYDEIDGDGDAVNPVCPTGKPVNKYMTPPVLTNHGDWGDVALCFPSAYVVGMRLKIQNKQGFWKDDTSLNGIRLICSDGKELVSAEGSKGAWNKPTMTKNDYAIDEVALRSDEDSASDNAATSGVRFWDIRNKRYDAGYVEFGEWQNSKQCPGSTVIIGFQTQVEEYKTFNDKTGLNGVRFVCGT